MKFLEFSGTPSSGKSSVIKTISSQFKDVSKVVQANEELFTIQNSNFELKNIWTIFDTYSQLELARKEEVNACKTIILDRGLFDKIAWSRLLKVKNHSFTEVANFLENWLERQLLELSQYNDYKIFLFITSYEKIVFRKPSYLNYQSQGPWIINQQTINELNSIYKQLYHELYKTLNVILIDDLDNDFSLQQKISATIAQI